jgi:predicted RNA-binding protein YlqC (UPF0109 family)
MTKLESTAIACFKTIVESFIAYPDELTVSAMEGRDFVTVLASCNSKDFGRLVGDGGSTFKILKMLLALTGEKNGKRFILQRLPKTLGEREFPTPTRLRNNWTAAETQQIEKKLRAIAAIVLTHRFDISCNGTENETVFKMKIDDNEPLPVQHEELIFALSRIIGAVGKAHGREIRVESA